MKPPPNMPGFGQIPLLGQRPQPSDAEIQQQMRAQVQAAIGQLSMGIYSKLAVSHIFTRDDCKPAGQEEGLRQLAKDAQTAAKCYFEGIGVLQHDQGDSE